MKRYMSIVSILVVLAFTFALMPSAARADNGRRQPSTSQPNFGSNVIVFDPSMTTSQIQATVDAIANQQVNNEMGPQRYSLLFMPGTYGSAQHPLAFQVGYYTEVAGLGASPNDVTINGSVNVANRCFGPNNCSALDNFWRSLSNLTINVTSGPGCEASNEIWAVSQAAPVRRVQVNGFTTLWDYCSGLGFASGGFIADSKLGYVLNSTQQQFFVRNSTIGAWSNAVWNQVFSGVVGAPAQSFPNPPYTTLASSPVSREKPFLYVDSSGNYNVFVPAIRRNSIGESWASGPTAGTSIPIDQFYVAHPGDSVSTINNALARGLNLIFTPGIYQLDDTIRVKRPDTVVLGMGFATLVPNNGVVAMSVADVAGVKLAGLLFDAGPVNSPVLLQIGTQHGNAGGVGALNGRQSDPSDPTTVQDVFFRIGGATPGKATVSLEVNTDNTILDDVWAWRADHGNGVGWTANTADTGVIVNGDNVTAYGLFVEHYQKYEVIWNGNGGTDIFFQNEMPYDVPSQAAWNEAPGVLGYAAFKVADTVTSFNGYGMGSYSFFNQGVDIYASHAFEVPTTLPAGSLHDLLTVFLDPVHGRGGILNVVNNTGGPSTAANADTPVTVVSYP